MKPREREMREERERKERERIGLSVECNHEMCEAGLSFFLSRKKMKEGREKVFLLSKCSFHSLLLLLLVTTRSRPSLNSPSFTFLMRWLNECFRHFFLSLILFPSLFLPFGQREKDPKRFVSKEYNWASILFFFFSSSFLPSKTSATVVSECQNFSSYCPLRYFCSSFINTTVRSSSSTYSSPNQYTFG